MGNWAIDWEEKEADGVSMRMMINFMERTTSGREEEKRMRETHNS